MPEQAPKTPKQIGKEAKALYANHGKMYTRRGNIKSDIQFSTVGAKNAQQVIQMIAEGRGRSRDNPFFPGDKEHSEGELRQLAKKSNSDLDKSLRDIGELVLEQVEVEDELKRNREEAQKHFEQHAAGYHELAFHEAAIDGVEIKVQQPSSPAESIEVHKG